MGIPIGQKYTCTVSGRIIKNVTCVHCKSEYVYLMQREVSGEGTSIMWADNDGAQKRAAESANEMLANKLKNDCDYVGCPDCGNYQPNMIRKKRIRRFWAVMGPWLVLAFIAWAAYGFPSHRNDFIDWVDEHWMILVAGLLALLAIGLSVVFLMDLNKDPKSRIVREYSDQTKAIRKADFEAMMAEQEGREERERRAPVSLQH